MNFVKKNSKSAVLLFIILAFLFSVSVENAEAQCDPGFTYTTVTVPYPGGCSYIVGICFKCAPSSNGFEFKIVSYTPANVTCYNYLLSNLSAINSFSETYIRENYSHSLCIIPPCNQGTDGIVIINTAMCWKKCVVNNNIDLVACDGAYCKKNYSACYNYTTRRTQGNLLSYILIGTIECSEDNVADPISGCSTCWHPADITCP
jgi:hypothetical protein